MESAEGWRHLAYDVFGEPDPASGVDVDADANVVEGSAGQVDAVPAGGRLVDHAFLYGVDAAPGGWIGAREANTLAAVCKLEAFVGDADALIYAIWAGMAEATMHHVPAMQASASGEGAVPNKWIEAANSTVMVDQGE